jgi:hypothetical protein
MVLQCSSLHPSLPLLCIPLFNFNIACGHTSVSISCILFFHFSAPAFTSCSFTYLNLALSQQINFLHCFSALHSAPPLLISLLFNLIVLSSAPCSFLSLQPAVPFICPLHVRQLTTRYLPASLSSSFLCRVLVLLCFLLFLLLCTLLLHFTFAAPCSSASLHLAHPFLSTLLFSFPAICSSTSLHFALSLLCILSSLPILFHIH